MAFPKVVSAWSEGARARSVSGHATRSARRAVFEKTARFGKGGAKGRSRRLRVARAFVASSSVGSKRNRVSIGYRSRLGDAATPRADAKWPDRRETAGRRGAFCGRKEGDVPGDHSSLAICRLVYSVVPLGTAPARRGGSSVGPDRRAACRNGAARERGGERGVGRGGDPRQGGVPAEPTRVEDRVPGKRTRRGDPRARVRRGGGGKRRRASANVRSEGFFRLRATRARAPRVEYTT